MSCHPERRRAWSEKGGPGIQFRNREEAGQRLAAELSRCQIACDRVVALPRGGVIVAEPVAARYRVPLSVLVVRKVGAPGQEELAAGALGPGQQLVFNDRVCRQLNLDAPRLAPQVARAAAELEERTRLYRHWLVREVVGESVVLIDDGIATGFTAEVALRILRNRRPHRLVLAVPVAPPATLRRLQELADQVVCLHAPRVFRAVGQFYADFRPVSDDQVLAVLHGRDRSASGDA